MAAARRGIARLLPVVLVFVAALWLCPGFVAARAAVGPAMRSTGSGAGAPEAAASGTGIAPARLPAQTTLGATQRPQGIERPQAAGEQTALEPQLSAGGWAARGIVALLLLPGAVWLLRRPRHVNRIGKPGFEIISQTEPRRFIPLDEKYQALDFVTEVSTRGQLRVSANLNKVSLSIRRYGYLMEDKNYRNALLVNRRRVRRTVLRDGDVLDLGDLTLLYRDNRNAPIVRHSPVTPPEGKLVIKFDRARGPVRKGTPMLVPEQFPNRTFYITKNMVFIGRSERNDLVVKAQEVAYSHAKIERIGGRYKLQNVSPAGTTYVNNRRVEQRFLKEGDEIAIEGYRFRFEFATRPIRERSQRAPAGAEAEPPAAEPENGTDPDLTEDQD